MPFQNQPNQQSRSQHSQNCSKNSDNSHSKSCTCTLHQMSSGSHFQLQGTPTTGSRKIMVEQLNAPQIYPYNSSDVIS